jgi:hypothetical protein
MKLNYNSQSKIKTFPMIFFFVPQAKNSSATFLVDIQFFFQIKLTHTCTDKYISYMAFIINFHFTFYMAVIRPPNCYIYMKPHTHTHEPMSHITPLTNLQVTKNLKPKKQSHRHITSKVIYTFPKFFFLSH